MGNCRQFEEIVRRVNIVGSTQIIKYDTNAEHERILMVGSIILSDLSEKHKIVVVFRELGLKTD